MTTIDLSISPASESLPLVTRWLEGAGYRVIRPLVERAAYSTASPPEKLIRVAILDTETTGTDAAKDKVIELGIVVVEVCPVSGQAYRVLTTYNALEDPGFPIPEESTCIHGITDEMVAGKRIDDRDVQALLADVALIVAHNARFDRPFVEQRFPVFSEKAWACSFAQIPWADEGVGSGKLEFLAYRCGFHYGAHRASVDCHALLEVLQHPLPTSGSLAMQVLLATAREPGLRIAALGSPFESKDLLKGRGYRWNAPSRVWETNLRQAQLKDEVAWLRSFVYGGKPFRLEQETLTAKIRFSTRTGAVETVRYE